MKHLLRYLFLVPTALFAAAPVPTEVLPERIPGARPRNVVFILSDDLRGRGGDHASDFPSPLVVDEPINTDAN